MKKQTQGQKITITDSPNDLENLPSYKNHPVLELQKAFPQNSREWTVDYFYPSKKIHLDVRYKEDEEICLQKQEIMKKNDLDYKFKIV